jgi:hypothetical protein
VEEVERPTVLMDTTCRTSNCVNENVTHRVNVPVNSDGVFRVVCGTCSQRVTDLVEVNEDLE